MNHVRSHHKSRFNTAENSLREALEPLHDGIGKLHPQRPIHKRKEHHCIEYLRYDVIGNLWAEEPTTWCSAGNMTYHNFYSQLAASLQREQEEMDAIRRAKRVSKTSVAHTQTPIISYAGHPATLIGLPDLAIPVQWELHLALNATHSGTVKAKTIGWINVQKRKIRPLRFENKYIFLTLKV